MAGSNQIVNYKPEAVAAVATESFIIFHFVIFHLVIYGLINILSKIKINQ